MNVTTYPPQHCITAEINKIIDGLTADQRSKLIRDIVHLYAQGSVYQNFNDGTAGRPKAASFTPIKDAFDALAESKKPKAKYLNIYPTGFDRDKSVRRPSAAVVYDYSSLDDARTTFSAYVEDAFIVRIDPDGTKFVVTL